MDNYDLIKFNNLRERLKKHQEISSQYIQTPQYESPRPFKQKLDGVDARKKTQELEHDEKDHQLKEGFARYVKTLLVGQNLVIFFLIFWQGFGFYNFKLDNYIFYILISGTLIQSYFLVRIIIEHFFPKNNK